MKPHEILTPTEMGEVMEIVDRYAQRGIDIEADGPRKTIESYLSDIPRLNKDAHVLAGAIVARIIIYP